jgi:site-specific recombinase XerD
MDEYIFYLKSKNLSFTTQTKAVYSIRLLYKVNNISVNFSFKIPRRAMLISRAITLEELSQILSIATLREKAIVGILAVSGLRTGTLVKLQYKQVRHDLEHGLTPLHIAIEPQIAKGMDHSYSTFINAEVAEFLKQYLDMRRKGSRRLPSEIIEDQSPLIKLEYQGSKIQPTTASNIGCMLRQLFFRSGILTKKPNMHSFGYELGVNSLRKFLRTQMAVLGVEGLYIEYMMGHKRDRYLDVKMVGVEYLRKVYDLSGISIKPPTDDQFALLKKSIE